MKTKIINTIKDSRLLALLIMVLCAAFGIAGVEAVAAVAPLYGDQILDENGTAIDGLIDLKDASDKAPELISKKFVQEVVRMDPYSYPTMSILSSNFHWKKKEKTKDHIIQVNRVTTPPVQITVATAVVESAQAQLAVDFGEANRIVGLHQTIIFKGIDGYKEDGETKDGYFLQCRVVSKDGTSGKPVLKPLNGKKVDGVITIPNIPVSTVALRGPRVGTETQIRTAQFGILPTPTDYFVSKRLIEFGTSGWYDNASKTIKWGDPEIKQTAMTEFLRTSAPAFWLGKQTNQVFEEFKSGNLEMALFEEGLLPQAGRELDLQGELTIKSLINLEKVAFGDNNSGNLKYFAMGDEISPRMQELIFETKGLNHRVFHDQTLDIAFTEITYSGGKRVRFIDDPSLNDCGMNDHGFVLDPKYAGHFSYGFEFRHLDGNKQEERDYTGMVAIDESVRILTNPDANVVVTL